MAKYKAKKSYNTLSDSENFLSLGMASKHAWLKDGLEIAYNGELSEELEKHLTKVGEKKAPDKGDK
tara:strand:- start:185 stop:382 length:198 start_codon:yes stop_codon:yes gene_type:complete